MECPSGSVSKNMSSVCKQCVAGKFESGTSTGSPRTSCEDCAAGTKSDLGASECKRCGLGHYGPDGISCTECGVGRHANVTGLSECLRCEPGRATLDDGTVRCEVCKAGKAAPGAFSRCRVLLSRFTGTTDTFVKHAAHQLLLPSFFPILRSKRLPKLCLYHLYRRSIPGKRRRFRVPRMLTR